MMTCAGPPTPRTEGGLRGLYGSGRSCGVQAMDPPDGDDEGAAHGAIGRQVDELDDRGLVVARIRPAIRARCAIDAAAPAPRVVALLNAVRPAESTVRRDEEQGDDVSGRSHRTHHEPRREDADELES